MYPLKIKIIEPAKSLKPFIFRYEWLEVKRETNGEHILNYPGFLTGFVFIFYKDKKILINNSCIEDGELRECCLIPPTIYPTFNSRFQNLSALRCIFMPGAIYAIYGVSMEKVSNAVVDLSTEIDPELGSVFRRMEDNQGPESCVKIFENYLLQKLRFTAAPKLYSATIKEIQQHGYDIKIEDLAKKLGKSERNLRRLMSYEFGFSTKKFLKLYRFCDALGYMQKQDKINLTQTALQFGYGDQAYFTNEFKKLTTYTPKQYLKILQKEEVFGSVEDKRLATLFFTQF